MSTIAPSAITEEDVKKVARLARLVVDQEAINRHVKSLSTILDMIAHINEQDTTNITAMSTTLETTLNTRPDEVTENNQRSVLQKLAPQVESGLYLVPQVIE